MPISTDIDEGRGLCPDLTKHPIGGNDEDMDGVVNEFEIYETFGEGNEWYRAWRRRHMAVRKAIETLRDLINS